MLLAIETSSLVSSVALLHEDSLRAELTIQAKLTHSEQLMPHIADMLQKASVKKSQIDGVAVSASAKALSFAWQVPIAGIETPRALAWNFMGMSYPVCVLIDAQKGNVYASTYLWHEWNLEEQRPVTVMPVADVLTACKSCGGPVVFCGDGAILYQKQIQDASPMFYLAPPTMRIPRAGSLAMAAKRRLDAGDCDDCMTLTPAYKRRSEAEVLWEKRHGETLCL